MSERWKRDQTYGGKLANFLVQHGKGSAELESDMGIPITEQVQSVTCPVTSQPCLVSACRSEHRLCKAYDRAKPTVTAIARSKAPWDEGFGEI